MAIACAMGCDPDLVNFSQSNGVTAEIIIKSICAENLERSPTTGFCAHLMRDGAAWPSHARWAAIQI